MQEGRTGNPVPLEPTVVINDEPADELPPFDIDIDQLKDELGIGDIHNTLKVMDGRILKLSNPSHSTKSVQSSPVSSQFDPAEDLMAQDK